MEGSIFYAWPWRCCVYSLAHVEYAAVYIAVDKVADRQTLRPVTAADGAVTPQSLPSLRTFRPRRPSQRYLDDCSSLHELSPSLLVSGEGREEGVTLPSAQRHGSRVCLSATLPGYRVYNALCNRDKPLSMPALWKIYLANDDPFYVDSRNPWRLLALCAPKLHSATLRDITLPANCACALRELHLTTTSRSPESLKNIHNFLRLCIQLETLYLDLSVTKTPFPQIIIYVNLPEYHAKDVHLSNLKHATLSVESDKDAFDVWKPIIVSDSVDLRVSCQGAWCVSSTITPMASRLCAAHAFSGRYYAMALGGSPKWDVSLYNLDAKDLSDSCAFNLEGDVGLFDHLLSNFIRAANIRSLFFDGAFIATHRISDICRILGAALTAVTNLSLKHMKAWPASLYIRAFGRGNNTPVFPALESLRLSDIDLIGTSRDPARSHTQSWWDTVFATLSARRDANSSVLRCLVLEGCWWSTAVTWDRVQDNEEKVKVCSHGLVQDMMDNRDFVDGAPQ